MSLDTGQKTTDSIQGQSAAAERLRELLTAVAKGRRPNALQRALAKRALMAWQDGARLDEAFGVRPGRGERHPGVTLLQSDRDGLVRIIAAGMNGSAAWRARELVRVVRAESPAPPGREREVSELRRIGLPGERQIRRLIDPDSEPGHEFGILWHAPFPNDHQR